MSPRHRRTRAGATLPALDEAAAWHDVECGGYTADLRVWRELAQEAQGLVLELGAGTGRVALDLAERGHPVVALDVDPALTAALTARARGRGSRLETVIADARSFDLGRSLALVIAPMQVVQLLGGAAGRRAMLEAARRHLMPGGTLAMAIADPLEGADADSVLPPPPDVREVDGWVYSSRPVTMREAPASVAIDRVREAVSPDGELHRSMVTVDLDRVTASDLEALGAEAGFAALPRRAVPATGSYVGSEVVVLECALPPTSREAASR